MLLTSVYELTTDNVRKLCVYLPKGSEVLFRSKLHAEKHW